MKIYLPPSMKYFRPEFMTFSTWVDHMPFGYDLVEALKPALLVELGTQGGLSFFTFCQSVRDHSLDTVCYAVDCWEGDKHADKYDESVFEAVKEHARRHYPGFAYLMRMYFNEALAHFSDESIDLLHIDGLHTYEAVAEDFRNWYPKVRPGGVILFHDTMAKMMDFGVWKFWAELEEDYETFLFHHGFGLGVLRKPGGERPSSTLLELLFDGTDAEAEELRKFYVCAAEYHDYRRKVLGSRQGMKGTK